MTLSTDHIIAVCAAVPGFFMAFLAWRQTRKVHSLINSRLTELLRLTAESAHAEGRLAAHAENGPRGPE